MVNLSGYLDCLRMRGAEINLTDMGGASLEPALIDRDPVNDQLPTATGDEESGRFRQSAPPDMLCPHEQYQADRDHNDTKNRILTMAAHPRPVQCARPLCDPDRADQAEHDTDNSSNPHELLLSGWAHLAWQVIRRLGSVGDFTNETRKQCHIGSRADSVDAQ